MAHIIVKNKIRVLSVDLEAVQFVKVLLNVHERSRYAISIMIAYADNYRTIALLKGFSNLRHFK